MGEQTAECRNCGMKLVGEPFHLAKNIARHPKTGDQCKINYYGGYVCSESCDRAATRKQDRSIDEHMDPFGAYR